MVTRARELTHRHRGNLATLTQLAARATGQVMRTADPMAIEAWWTARGGRRVESIVAAGHRAAVTLSVRYLRESARVARGTVDPLPAPLDIEAMRNSLFVASVATFMSTLRRTGSPDVARRAMSAATIRSVQRLILAGDRDTVVGTMAAGR